MVEEAKETKKPKEKPEKVTTEAEATKEPAKADADKKETAAAKKVEKPKKEEKKSKKGWLIGIIIGVVVAAAAAVVAAIMLNRGDPSDPTASLSYSKSFFISDNGKATLWNAEGKRVNEESYDATSTFVGGYAYVRKDSQYGVVKEDGNMSVDFGKYGTITPQGGLYLAQDGNTKEYFLLTGSGKELEHNKTLKGYYANSYAGAVAVKVDDKIKLYNYDGKLMAETEVDDSASDPVLNYSNDFGIMFYNQKNYVFDARSGRMLAEFGGARYIFNDVSEDRGKVLLKNNSETGKYKLLVGDKTYELDETKNYSMTNNGIVVGYDNYSALSILDNDYKVIKKVSTYLQLKDSYNYAVENDDKNAEIYRNGESHKSFGEDSSIGVSGVVLDNLYAITVGNNKVKFYTLDGEEAFGGHEYYDVDALFDKYHHAVVADKKNEYYLIDTDGNKVDDAVAKDITAYDGGYEFENSDGKNAIAGKDGKLVTEFKYSSLYYRTSAKPRNIWTGYLGNSKYDVVDVDSGKVILSEVNVISFYANYFTVKNKDSKTEYYTYTGELFFTSTK